MWAGKVCVVTFLEVLKNEIQNLFSDDILSEVIGLVGWQKERKSLKWGVCNHFYSFVGVS